MNPDSIADAAKFLHDRDIPAELIDEWTRQTAAPKPASDQGRAKALLLRAGDEWLALPGSMLEEALAAGPIHVVPYLSTPVFPGLTNVGGELLPCINLARLLGQSPSTQPLPAPQPGEANGRGKALPRLLAVTGTAGRFALLVDEVAGMCSFDPEQLTPAPDTLTRGPNPLVAGMALLEGRTAGLIDATALTRALSLSLTGSAAP